jgi:tetratricopeptide (TPR) repeat protein
MKVCDRPEGRNSSGNNSAAIPITCVASIVLISLHAIFSFLLPAVTGGPFFKRTWGFDALRYFPLPCIAAFYLIALLVALPPVNRALWRVIDSLYAVLRTKFPPLNRHLAIALFCLATVPVFWAMHSKYALLGDNFLRVINMERGDFLRDECGTIYLLHYFYKLLNLFVPVGAYRAMQIFTYLTGGVLVFLVIKIADEAGIGRFEKIAIVVFYPLFGTIQHFCGYIEDYASAVVLIVAYFYTAQRSLKGRLSPWVTGCMLLVAIVDHLIACMLVPSFIYVLFECRLKKIRFFRDYRAWFGMGLIAATALFIPFKDFILPRLYPFVRQGDGRMTLFSLIRIREFLNGVTLSSGIGLILCVACLCSALRKKITLTPFLNFLIIASVCSAGFLFAFDEHFGSGDWDVYSFSAVPINLLAILLFLHQSREGGRADFRRFAALILIVFLALHTIPWVLVNATDRSIKRIKDVYLTDPATSYLTNPAPMRLGIVFRNNGLPRESDSMFRRAFEIHPEDPRNVYNYIGDLELSNELDKALRLNDTLTRKNPDYYLGLKNLFNLASKKGDNTLAFQALVRIFNAYLDNPHAITGRCDPNDLSQDFSMLIHGLLQQKRLGAADTVCKFMRTFCPDDDYGRYLQASIMVESGKFDEGLALCGYLIGKEPGMHQPYLVAAKALAGKGDRTGAITLLKSGIGAVPYAEGRNALLTQLHLIGG